MSSKIPENISSIELAKLYVELHNSGVETGDFSAMLKLFTRDAEMYFNSIEAGPFPGIDSIAKAFINNPPGDKLLIFGMEQRDKSVVLEYGWLVNPSEKRGSIIFTFSATLLNPLRLFNRILVNSENSNIIFIGVPDEFNFARCLEFLDRNRTECLHFVDGKSVLKALKIRSKLLLTKLSCPKKRLKVEILKGAHFLTDPIIKKEIIGFIRQWLDLDSDLKAFYTHARKDKMLAALVKNITACGLSAYLTYSKSLRGLLLLNR